MIREFQKNFLGNRQHFAVIDGPLAPHHGIFGVQRLNATDQTALKCEQNEEWGVFKPRHKNCPGGSPGLNIHQPFKHGAGLIEHVTLALINTVSEVADDRIQSRGDFGGKPRNRPTIHVRRVLS